MNADEYARLPNGDTIDELVAGEVASEPLRSFGHARIQASLATRLHAHVQARGLGVTFSGAGFLLATNPDTVRGPDIAFVRGDRYDRREEGSGYFRGAPDLAVILSTADRLREVHAKVADLLAAGSKLVWLVDPDHRCVLVYRSLLSPRTIPEDGVLEGENVLPGFTVKISDVLEL